MIGELILKIPTDWKLVLIGDFNAHLTGFLPFHNNRIGKIITQIQENLELNIRNDGKFTYHSTHDQPGIFLDLYLVSSDLALVCTSETLDESFDSDHYTVTLTIPLQMETTCKSSTRLQTKKVEWSIFHEQVLLKFSNFSSDPGNNGIL